MSEDLFDAAGFPIFDGIDLEQFLPKTHEAIPVCAICRTITFQHPDGFFLCENCFVKYDGAGAQASYLEGVEPCGYQISPGEYAGTCLGLTSLPCLRGKNHRGKHSVPSPIRTRQLEEMRARVAKGKKVTPATVDDVVNDLTLLAGVRTGVDSRLFKHESNRVAAAALRFAVSLARRARKDYEAAGEALGGSDAESEWLRLCGSPDDWLLDQALKWEEGSGR